MSPAYTPPSFQARATLAANSTDAILVFGQDLVATANDERRGHLMDALNSLAVAALQFRAAAAAAPTCRDCDDSGMVVYDGQASPCPICEERALQAREPKAPR
jgi:hypothetical protein